MFFSATRERVLSAVVQPAWRRGCLGLALALLAAGCAASPSGGGSRPGPEGAGLADRQPLAERRVSTVQQTARPVLRAPGSSSEAHLAEVTPAGLSVLPVPSVPRARPVVMRASRPLQCVPYARQISGIALRGNAWTWWSKAEGRYQKGHKPQPGAVMVFSKTRRLRFGHLAVVVEVLDSRTVVVHQANWLNAGRIHRYTPVVDVSKNNDWSRVKVWYTPGHTMGSRSYAVSGFIYPDSQQTPETRQAAN